MKNLDDLLRQNREALTAQLANGLPTDKEDILALLTTMTEVHRFELDVLAPYGKELVQAALRAGVDQVDLDGVPYHASQVRRLAREAGIKPAKSGPRPKRTITAALVA